MIEKYLQSNQNYLLETFVAFLNRIDYLYPNIQDLTILYFYHKSFMHLLLAFAYQLIE